MQSRASPQSPTCLNVRVKTTEEAHLVLHKVALNHLPMIHNRLLEDERWSVREGSVFVWEERKERDNHNSSAISRWTDGRRWGPSRVKDEFLIYHEHLPDVPDNMDPAEREEFIASRLIKQTYSAWVQLVGGRKKWHLVAYYSQRTDKTLPRILSIPDFALCRGTYTPDRYTSARAPRTRPRSNSNQSEENDDDSSDDSDRSDEPQPAPPQVPVAGPSHTSTLVFDPQSFLVSPVDRDPLRAAPAPAVQCNTSATVTVPAPGSTAVAGPSAVPPSARPQTPSERSEGGEYALAPLVYDRMSPYPPRHPVDSVALRSLDVRVRIL
ncbi:Gti1/Pac2 family-domain-containing protein [Rhodofomes roseus]|uniref:Gti1/Pac2 family-domain-containing protein n=1 Tax=Rhodofomes roseus TaxID=34475 RepID=A0ABQ8KM52_9APHY|nr:Gti1/Pac2 family-domain-containing protein [Rhodofomes roseus]KAH9839128.1 Gti1/Pac2 family-domain-containing protein [Rhodofomes roseus]